MFSDSGMANIGYPRDSRDAKVDILEMPVFKLANHVDAIYYKLA